MQSSAQHGRNGLDDDLWDHLALLQDKFQLEMFEPILSLVPGSRETTWKEP